MQNRRRSGQIAAVTWRLGALVCPLLSPVLGLRLQVANLVMQREAANEAALEHTLSVTLPAEFVEGSDSFKCAAHLCRASQVSSMCTALEVKLMARSATVLHF